MIDILLTLQSWLIDHSQMFAYVGMAGICMTFGIPLFIGIMAGSKQKQEERVQNAKMLAKEQGRPKTWSI
jgi:hypothetical protein